MGARAATALRRAHLSAPLPRPTPGDRPTGPDVIQRRSQGQGPDQEGTLF